MTARRSTSDPVSPYLETGERVVWRHRPDGRALFYNRLPALVIVLLIMAFVGGVATMIISNALPDQMPTEFSMWFIVPAIFIGFVLFILYFFVRFIWNELANLFASWSTLYALTDRRFMIVSQRGVIDYDASYFRKMDPVAGEPGKHVLLFDWGPSGKSQTDTYRARIACLPDAQKLERLIRDTLRA